MSAKSRVGNDCEVMIVSSQNRKRAVIVNCRIPPTPVTRPKVGELRTVSIVVYCGVLKMFVDWARNSSTRDSFNGKTLVNAISNTWVPGPMMLLRRALPICPVGGAAKAAVLNHAPIDGFELWIDCPETKSGRKVPLVPRLTSVAFPRSRGVKGNPDAIVKSPLHCQSPRIARHGEFPVSHRFSWPKGSS